MSGAEEAISKKALGFFLWSWLPRVKKKGISFLNNSLKGIRNLFEKLGSLAEFIPLGYTISPVCQMWVQSEFDNALATLPWTAFTLPLSPIKQNTYLSKY